MKNNNTKTILLSLLVMALWGSLYPFIKIGYSAFKHKILCKGNRKDKRRENEQQKQLFHT